MDEHNYLFKNGDVLKGPLKIATDQITHDLDLINKEYLEDVLDNLDLDGDFLPLAGGVMTGNIGFTGPRMLDASTGVSNLTNRATLLLKTSSLPIGISSPSSSASALSVFGFATGVSDSREEVIKLKANGEINNKHHIISEGLFKTTRDTGYALQVRPGGSRDTGYIRTDGSVEFLTTRTSDVAFSIKPAGLDASNGKYAFRVTADGKVKAGHASDDPFMATDENDVVTKKYYEDGGEFVKLAGTTTVEAGFLLKAVRSTNTSSTNSYININNDKLYLYHVSDPGSGEHAMNLQYADANYLNLAGGTMTGKLDIDMTNRADAALRVGGKFAVKKGTSDIGGDNIFEVTKDYARYKGPVTNDYDIATRKYIEDRPTIIRKGTSTNPTLASGELFWNTSNKVLYIGN